MWTTSVNSVQPFCCWNYAMRFVHEACESGSVLRDDFGKLFETNLKGWFPVWLEASDRQIHLTCLLSGNAAKKGTADPRKRAIAFLKLNQPGIAHRNICAKLDASLDRLSREGVLETLQHLNRLTSYGVGYRSFTEQYFDSCGIFKDAVIAIIATVAPVTCSAGSPARSMMRSSGTRMFCWRRRLSPNTFACR